ncbi:MAG: hypothetical protein ACP5HS_03775 [Anaerolineae bacterium]
MVKLEIFSGDPPCPGCVALVELTEKVASRYDRSELEVVVLKGAEAMEKFDAYELFCVPAAVVTRDGDPTGTIRIEGMCPSEATLNNALREGGLCLK